jgi:hypothetical protein
MKKVLVLAGFLAVSVVNGYCVDSWGQQATDTAINITSSTVITSAAVDNGTVRIYYNNGSATVWVKKASSTNILTTGLPIVSKGFYMTDEYFGTLYFLSETTTNNVRFDSYLKYQY